ncbi:MAG TPA: hypothetical protein VNI84_19585 [Pyrinomonadaceae bacterium]|nr:hypothetical protein [Pyrinomonadaceae bacterium]
MNKFNKINLIACLLMIAFTSFAAGFYCAASFASETARVASEAK